MKLLRALFVLALAAGAAVVFIPPVRVAVLSVLLIPHFFPGDVARPLTWVTRTPTVETIAVPDAPGRMVADVYRPAGDGRKPAMILFLGVSPLPRNHPQVTTLAEGIARTGIAAVVAESPALMNGEIRFDEVDNLVALYQYLERDERIDSRHIGFSGFCIGAVLELLAAADERIADRVSYVNAFSVFADPIDVLRAILTQTQPGRNGPEPWVPSDLTRSVFVRHLLGLVGLDRDRELLNRAYIANEQLPLTQITQLSPIGAAVFQLLRDHDPSTVDRVLSQLAGSLLAPLERISPQRAASRLRAKVFIMHDVNDSYLPVSGARTLAAAMPAATNVQYTEFRLFSHVVPGGVDDPVQFAREMLKLVGHINAVMQVAQLG